MMIFVLRLHGGGTGVYILQELDRRSGYGKGDHKGEDIRRRT